MCGLLCLASFTWNNFSKFILVVVHAFYGKVIFHCMDNTPFCLSIHQLMGTWVISTFWLS